MIKKILAGVGVVIAVLIAYLSTMISSWEIVFNTVLGGGIEPPSSEIVEERLVVPEGYSIVTLADGLTHARFMVTTDSGDIIITQSRPGLVTWVDGSSGEKKVLLEGLNRPHGLAWDGAHLYIAETDAVARATWNHAERRLTDYEVVIPDLPDTGNHWTKSIEIHGDRLFLSMGSTCNVCEEADVRRATIMSYDMNSWQGEVYASGLRNSVGLDFAPWSGELYATDNGRDLLGDDYPICELNLIEQDHFYGWPYINGYGDLDPDFGALAGEYEKTSVSPVFGFRAHNAPLGLHFLRDVDWGDSFAKTALVALHGSWNRREPDGYKVVALHWADDGSITSSDFIAGFEADGDVIGRPVDIAEYGDCVFISDDYAGVIYKVCNREQSKVKASLSESLLVSEIPELDSIKINQGRELYHVSICSSCHMIDGVGNPSGKPLDGLHRRYSVESLAAYFLVPNPPMPQYPLTDEERLALSQFLLSGEAP